MENEYASINLVIKIPVKSRFHPNHLILFTPYHFNNPVCSCKFVEI